VASRDPRNAARRVAAKQREKAYRSALATHLRDLKSTLRQSKEKIRGASLSGRRILVVEDDYAQASELANDMRAVGIEVVGPFPRAKEALLELRYDNVDAAVLDIYLGEGKCFELAEAQLEKRKPFIFLTGYDRAVVPSRYAEVPFFQKPSTMRDFGTYFSDAIG